MFTKKLIGAPALLIAASLTLAMIQSTPAKAGDVDGWMRQVATLVGKNQGYPRSAQVRKLEGSAKVKLTVEASGAISSYELVESSTHDILDKEVEKLVKKIDPLPAPPDSAQRILVLPLTWRLN